MLSGAQGDEIVVVVDLDRPREPQVSREVDFALEEIDDVVPLRPPSIYDGRWFLANGAVFAIAFLLLAGVALLEGAGSGRAGGEAQAWGGPAAPAGMGRWDSFDYTGAQEAGQAAGGGAQEQAQPGAQPAAPGAEAGGIGSEAVTAAQPGGAGGTQGEAGAPAEGEEELESGATAEPLKGTCALAQHEPSGESPGAKLVAGTMKSYGSLYKLFADAGVAKGEGARVVKALEKVLDIKKLRADDKVKLYVRTEGGAFWFLEYARSETKIYHALAAADGAVDVHEVVFPTEKKWTKAAGVVQGSLYLSVKKAGLDGSIANHFIEVLGAYVNFDDDTREDDSFKVIVSSKWIGRRFLAYDPPQALQYTGSRTGEVTAILYPPDGAEGLYYKPDGMSLTKIYSDVPIAKPRVTSPFNPKRLHPILKVVKPHMGVDFGAPAGTPVFSFMDGTVKKAGPEALMGIMVQVDHAGGYQSFYGHLSRSADGMKAGVKVKKGKVVGYVGSTGRSTGPHLHFGLKKNGTFVDPVKLMKIEKSKEQMIAPAQQGGFFKRAKTVLSILGSLVVEGGAGAAPPAAKQEERVVPQPPAPVTGGKGGAPKQEKKKAPAEGAGAAGWDNMW